MQRRLFTVLMVAFGAALAADAGEGTQLYRLTSDSRIERVTQFFLGSASVESSRLSGYLRLVPAASPLDWNAFQVEDIALTAADAPTNSLAVTGTGLYRWGGRTGDQQTMTLSAAIDGVSWDLESGVVNIQDPWPALLITVTASHGLLDGNQKLTIILHALPVVPATHYRLIEGSTLLDDCPICDRLSRPQPLRGEFDLMPVSTNSLSTRYHLFDVKLRVVDGSGVTYTAQGEGDYTLDGEVALQQRLSLDVLVTGGGHDPKPTTLTNSAGPPGRLWPMLAVDLMETRGTPTQTYSLELRAAPFRELWFTTTQQFRPASGLGLPQEVLAGDALSDQGRIVKSNADLLAALGVLEGTKPIAVDALDVAPGGALLFSLGKGVTSTNLGSIQEGDLVSDAGKIMKRNQDLTAQLGIMPVVPDEGLDAVQVMERGGIIFSTRRDDFSESQGPVSHGGLLSDQGQVMKTNPDLLRKFHPDQPGHDYGLDAVHLWPSGELWFSTEEGFNDSVLGPINDGDLLSDRGYVVSTSVELVARFQPADGLTNYGLASLFVVTDLLPLPATGPVMLAGTFNELGQPQLQWTAPGRCCQVEVANTPLGPFVPVSPILTTRSWTDRRGTVAAAVFYRVRQW
jgi:hypothetical protein